jgi:hypothetical protein
MYSNADMEELKARNCYIVPSLSIAWRGIRSLPDLKIIQAGVR